jgi:glycosyltransferase involved in cell wall biosynthesis
MRIGMDAQLLGRPGGVGGYIASLLSALARYDEANEYVIYTTRRAPLPGDLPTDLFRVRRVRLTGLRSFRVFWQQMLLPAALIKDGIDVFHAPSYVAPLRARVPVVLTLHDVIALTHPHLVSRASARHYRHVLPRSVKMARVVIASSEATRSEILARMEVKPGKVRVICPGVDPIFHGVTNTRELATVRAIWGLPEKFILFVGNVERKKNLETLIQAFAKLVARKDTSHHLVIAGYWMKGFDELMRLAGELQVRDKVQFTGPVAREALPALYSLADVLALPSHWEGFGLPLVEAMACGTPVVCSEVPALAEVAGDAALRVAPADAEAWANAITRALVDRELRAYLVARGEDRLKLFSWSVAVGRIVAAYADAFGGGRTAAGVV